MRNKIFVYSLIFFILYLIEVTIVPIKINNLTPEYIYIAVVLIAMFEKERYGAIYGLIAGLFCDFANGGLFGLKAVFFMLLGYCIGFLLTKMMSLNMFTSFLLYIFSFLIFQLLNFSIHLMYNDTEIIENAFIYVIIPKLLISLPLVAILYALFKHVYIKFYDNEKEEKQLWQ
ncbi:MAG: rod shape-determining protein MreD [Clostridia bacterium]|nr:rod shape-determining protein MreD [Clostridia bacterium]